MGRRSMTGGVLGKGRQRIQYDSRLNGVRYRPTLKAIPTEANLRRAREHLKAIKERIRCETFSFMEEFPDFRDWQKLVPHSSYRTCNQVFDQYLAHCESRLAKNDLSFATVTSYRKALDSVWRPQLGRWPSRARWARRAMPPKAPRSCKKRCVVDGGAGSRVACACR